ncbi:MAG: DUF11 domain-containing protein [Saprospiraceae bacterium]|nr:DUF11 domain-containing protein [Saprospiraceae bacterium]
MKHIMMGLACIFAITLRAQQPDLSLQMRCDKKFAKGGDTLTYTLTLINDGKATTNGITVNLPVPAGSNYLVHSAAIGTYDPATSLWNVGTLAATTDSVSVLLSVVLAQNTEGVVYNVAQVSGALERDVDSEPNNNLGYEDDCAGAATSVPVIYACAEGINMLATAPAGFSNYQWFKNGQAIAGATNRTYTIIEEGMFTFSAENVVTACPAFLIAPIEVIKTCVDPEPTIEIVKTIQVPERSSYCFTAAELGLSGDIVRLVNECEGNADNTIITLDSDNKCVNYLATSVGSDTACLRVITSTGDTVKINFIINVNATPCGNGNFIAEDSLRLNENCTGDLTACLTIPQKESADYSFMLNGQPYLSAIRACKNDTSISYSYFTVPNRGNRGPYTLDSWIVEGVELAGGTFSTISDLVATMNTLDAGANWALASGSYNIIGGNASKNYGAMRISRVNGTGSAVLQRNIRISPRGSGIMVAAGRSTLVVFDKKTGCTDSVKINATCVTPEFIPRDLTLGEKDTICLDETELVGSNFSVQNVSENPTGNVDVRLIPGTNCIEFTAMDMGDDSARFVLCDGQVCDTTTFSLRVKSNAYPVALNDSTVTPQGTPVVILPLANDSIPENETPTITIINQPENGTVTVSDDSIMTYTPNTGFCDDKTPEVIGYEVCTSAGCDTAIVFVTVGCQKVIVYTGFSPNEDGKNDGWVIGGIDAYPKINWLFITDGATVFMKLKAIQVLTPGEAHGKIVSCPMALISICWN